jgi:Cft2 family RNA processing exonuclease
MVYNVVEIYRRHGVELPGAELFDGDKLADRVVVMPPGIRRCREWKLIKNPYTMFLSGWALDAARRRSSVDAVLPLSDHADYPQLVAFVKQTNPEQVYTVHGFPDLASRLRERGLQARHVEKGECVDLLTGCATDPGSAYDLFGHPSA